jgi:thioredoxin 1
MKSIELNDDNFDSTLGGTDLPVLVDFHALWCGPCKMLGPVIEQIASEREGKAIIAKVDIDQAPGLARRFGITSVPSLIVFKGGEVKASTRGVQSKAALESMLDNAG